MIRVNGIHHIAIMASDIKKHVEFFSDVLGCRLAAIFDMHGVKGAYHAFMHLNDHCYFSIVQMDQVADLEVEIGKTHAGTGLGVSAPGTMQHLAFNVDSDEELLAIRDRIRSRGVNVIGPIEHGICASIYFAGPDQLTLEVATSSDAINAEAWIDPKVLAEVGIAEEEAERYRNPDAYAGEGGAVSQPPYDPEKPHQAYPDEVYQRMLSLSDGAIAASANHSEPPVKV